MNERIKELAERAAEFAALNENHDQSFQTLYDGKFAELILKDCVQVIEAGKIAWSCTDVPATVALDIASKNVKAYFGVKE